MSIRTTTGRVRRAAAGPRPDAERLGRYRATVRRRRVRRAAWALLRTGFGAGVAVGFRHRAPLWPFWVLGVLLVAGWTATLLSVGAACLLSLLGAGAVAFHLRGRLPRPAERAYAGACLAAAVTWLSLLAWAGPEHRMLNVPAVLAWTVAALLWWKHHQVRTGTGRHPAPASSTVELWETNLRAEGPMKGAELSGPVGFDHGESYEIQLVPGKQHIGTAQGALPLISSGIKTPIDRLIVEQHPEHPKDPTLLRMQRITNSPIEQTVYFDRPRHDNGTVLLGPHADGIGEAAWRIYTTGSMWGGFALGGIGSGKTRLIESIALTALDMGNTVIFYIDGQDGASSPTLFRHATWAAGADDAMGVLAALERIMRWRNKENRARGLTGFTPSADRPGIFVIIDEAHAILPQAAKRWLEIVRTCRKLGIAVLAADQNSGLPDVFGGEDALRANLLSGNGLGLRTNSRIAGSLLPGLEFDLYDLPVLPGFGYTIAAKGSGARTAPFRGRFLPDEEYRTEHPEVPVPTVEEWFTRYPALELDGPAARAAGLDYLQRHERAEREQQTLLDEVNGVAGASKETTAPGPGSGLQIVDDHGMTCAQRILALPWDTYSGEMERAQIIAELPPGTNVSTVTKALRDLTAPSGPLQRTGHGTYRRSGRSVA